jgi:uncharacterized protein
MLALTYPGVYVEELSSGVHTITGVATSIAAFIGWAPQGPTSEAVLVQSWSDFQGQFGGLSAGNYLGYAVSQFFSNGGQQAYIVRLVGSGCTAASSSANPIGGTLVLYAASPGAWGSDLQIAVTTQPGNAARFSLQVIDGASGKVLESYANLSVAANDPQYVVAVINADSQYVTFVNPTNQTSATPSGPPSSNNVPAPVQLPPVTHTTSGTLAAGQYFYQVSALYGPNNLESLPSSEMSVTTTGTTSSNTISWNAAASSYQNQPLTGYRIYRGTAAGNETGYYAPGNVTTFADTGAATLTTGLPVAVGLSGGQDGTVLKPNDGNFEPALSTALGLPGASNPLGLLDRVPIFNLLCVPGEQDAATIQALQKYCWTKRAFYIVDAPRNVSTNYLMTNGPSGTSPGSGGSASNQLNPNSNLTGQYSINSAYYFPWISAPDPLFGNRPTLFPPSGFMAGIYAATDANFGVWKAPAGIDASLTGVSGLQYTLTDIENGTLNIQAVNCLRQFRVYGDVSWGARTLQGNDQAGSQWKYVPIRRLALFIESSLMDGTQWVVFEPNDERLWSQIRLNVGAFMQGLFLQGAFQGTTPTQAYFVKCDAENNRQSSIDLGVVNVLVGFAPLYPAEFVVIQIQQMAGQLQA